MKRTIVILFLIVLSGAARVEAHAFLKDAEPRVGSTVQTSPGEVRIRFTENIEPAFSSIQVFDASGKEVDKRDVHLDRSDRAVLHVSLPQHAWPGRPVRERRFTRGRAALAPPGPVESDRGSSLRSALVLAGSREHEWVAAYARFFDDSVADTLV